MAVVAHNEKVVRTMCGMCYAMCSIRVRVRDGIAVAIEGDPESTYGARGGTCGKAILALQQLYDPYRINYPVRRTNPEKGFGVDPRWQRISWEEALGEIVEKLGAIRKDNPDKLLIINGPNNGRVGSSSLPMLGQWRMAYGTKNWTEGGAGLHCGSASHLGAGMNHASWSIGPDFQHCKYLLVFGAGKGVGTGHSMAMVGRTRADAAYRGLKVVSFDPVCHGSGGKATDWIPILPGTDLSVTLTIANLLVNEWGIYDKEYLQQKTNAPYLIKPDGRYIRDDSGDPLMWDLADNTVKNWKVTVTNPALEGEFEVRGVKVRPAFVLLREHLKQYTPEWAEGISTVPANTIRRVAREFGETANIGGCITIQGVTLPYRPVAAIQFRGGSGHSNGFHTYMSVDLLNHLMGACEVPGGSIGWAAKSLGNPWTGGWSFEPKATKDGHLTSTNWPTLMPGTWPHPTPRVPQTVYLADLFTCCPGFTSFPFNEQSEEFFQKFGLKYRTEAIFGVSNNMSITTHELENVEKFFKSVPFFAGSFIFHNETTEGFCDIVLPDTCALETLATIQGDMPTMCAPVGMLDHTWPITQPAVEPMFERRSHESTLNELAIRMGFTKEYYTNINHANGTMMGGPPPLDANKIYTWEEICDRVVRARFGDEHNLDWFKEHGFVKWPKKVEEAYWRPFTNARSSVYMEFLIDHGHEIKEICEPRGIKVDFAQYTPLLSWFPPATHREKDPELELYAFSYKDAMHQGGGTHGIPWAAEVSDRNPWHNFLMMNRKTAEAKGLKDLDYVYVENARGRKIKARIHTMEGVHPQCVAMIVGAGHFSKGLPLATNKGSLFNVLLEGDMDHLCPVSLNIETAVKVKIYKASESDPPMQIEATKPRFDLVGD
ncbi:MAG: molybdopterin-dependent oxidoreductase [Chloroflexi bacterium]|nr:molybdopterin-dependent oxidoreductase [Chloroflexota bacterium]